MLRLLKPEVYQGNKNLKQYFEGWYFKIVSEDESRVISLIPGISLNPKDPHSFIQYINGITGETRYVRYRVRDFFYEKDSFEVRIGCSYFSAEKMELNITEPGFNVYGELDFRKITPFPSSILSPGIMGWYSFVPRMECKHAVVSMNHTAHGKLKINNQVSYIKGGKSYIEKDWGQSFPAAWIWTQSNNFDDPGVSVMLSAAKIPWLGSYFMGFICFLLYDGKTYLFTTYNKSKLQLNDFDDKKIEILLQNRSHKLSFEIDRRKSGELKAPVKGEMSRMIKESVDSIIKIILSNKSGRVIYSGTGRRAGLEVTSNIFELLTGKVIS
jgi:hypothetical protein